jgi:hypothetical protein
VGIRGEKNNFTDVSTADGRTAATAELSIVIGAGSHKFRICIDSSSEVKSIQLRTTFEDGSGIKPRRARAVLV